MFKKRVALLTVALLLAVCSAFCFAACTDTNTGAKNITVYIGDKTFEVTTECEYLHGVLKELKDGGKIADYVYSGEGSNAYASKIDSVEQGASGPYISVWHSVDEFEFKSVYVAAYAEYNPSRSTVTEEDGTKFITYTMNSRLLYYSAVGVGMLPVRDGATYAILLD